MTQPKQRKEKLSGLVKFFQENNPENLLNILEIGIKAVIEAELNNQIGAHSYERTKNRTTYRNGVRARKNDLETSLGKVSVAIPKLRNGSFYPSIIEKFQRVDRAMVSIIGEAYINGVSTRKMERLFYDLGIDKMDKSLVSRCSMAIEEEVLKWKERPLDRVYSYVWLDAIYTKTRDESGVRSTAILIAIGLKEDGYRDVLGFHLGKKESALNWKEFLQSLKKRGLERSELWISDQHDGLIKSIEECFPGQLRQRCIVHWMRNAMDKVNKSDSQWMLPLLQNIVSAENKDIFDIHWKELLVSARNFKRNQLVTWLEDTYEEISTYLCFPPEHRSKIKSTNPIERLNEELRRRERCIRIFPDERSCIKLFGAILQDTSENWTCNRIYLRNPLERINEYRIEFIKAENKSKFNIGN